MQLDKNLHSGWQWTGSQVCGYLGTHCDRSLNSWYGYRLCDFIVDALFIDCLDFGYLLLMLEAMLMSMICLRTSQHEFQLSLWSICECSAAFCEILQLSCRDAQCNPFYALILYIYYSSIPHCCQSHSPVTVFIFTFSEFCLVLFTNNTNRCMSGTIKFDSF